LEQAERLSPGEARWPYLQVSLLPAHSNALNKARRAVALCGNEPPSPRLRLARLLMETGQREEARPHLEELLKHQPDLAPARLALAQIAHAEGRWDQALDWARACTTNAYTARTAWALLSALSLRRGDTNAAILASRRAAAVTPDVHFPDPFEDEVRQWRADARSLSDQAQEFLMAGRTAQAAPLIQRLSQKHPTFPETWLLLGRLKFLEKNTAAAEEALRRHLQLDPQSINGQFQLGMCLLAEQRYADAALTFERCIALKPDFGPAFFNLGFALAKTGQKERAVQCFRESIRHSPEHVESYILLADLHLQLGQTIQAARLADQAEALHSADPRLPVLRAKIQKQ
jgi:tetratricopeptide (TPR) repeat protein